MRHIILLLVSIIFSNQALAETHFAGNSLFHSKLQLYDQNAAHFTLAQHQGKIQVVAFVYTHCISICPIIVADLKRLDGMLPIKLKNQVQFLLISLDPENDSSISMKDFLKEHDIASSRWNFVRGSSDDTRELALLFDVRYRQDPSEIAHSNMISVLDTNGALLYQRKGNDPLNTVVNVIDQTLVNSGQEKPFSQ